MLRIGERDDICTVIVTVDAPLELVSDLADHARFGLREFTRFDGFLGGGLHLSQDRGRIVQYLQWGSESEYRACIDDPSWEEHASTQAFMEAVRTGRAKLDARIFAVDMVAEGSS